MQYRESKIPEATVQRLSIYLRYVTQLHRDGVKVVSSYDLSKGCGFKNQPTVRSSNSRPALPRFAQSQRD